MDSKLPPTPSLEPQSGGPGHLILFSLIGALVVIIGIGISFYFARNQFLSNETLLSSPTATVVPTSAETIDESSLWKVYQDDLKLFSFQYPSDAEVSVDPPTDKTLEAVHIHTQVEAENYGSRLYLNIFVSDQKDELTNEQIAQKLLADYKKTVAKRPANSGLGDFSEEMEKSIKPYRNGNIDGVYFIEPGTEFKRGHIIQVHNHKLFTFDFVGDNGATPLPEEAQKLLDDILKTFHYLDLEITPTASSSAHL